MTPVSTSKGSLEDVASWRVDVLETMLRVVSIAGPVIICFGLAVRPAPRFDATFALLTAAVIALIVLRFARTLPFRLRAGLSIAAMMFTCVIWFGRSGPGIGAAVGGVTAIVLSMMLLGRVVALTLLFATGIGMALLGAAIHAGALSVRLSDSDPLVVGNWLRWAVTFTLLTGCLTVAVDYVVRHVESKYAELSTAYDELAGLHRRLESSKEEERRLIARELHDDLGQSLTVLKLGLKTGKSTPFSDPLRVVDGLIVKVRELSRALRPPLLDEIGLAPALGAYLEEQSTVSGVIMDLDAGGFDGRLASELEIACFRIVQEAVTNALRHAEARRLKVRLEHSPATLRLEIEDDGRGFAGLPALVQAAIEGHIGIIGMRERVRALNGTFQIRSQPNKGTSIEVTMPLAKT
jgi:signal transduction histidine kinase